MILSAGGVELLREMSVDMRRELLIIFVKRPGYLSRESVSISCMVKSPPSFHSSISMTQTADFHIVFINFYIFTRGSCDAVRT